MQRLGMPMRRLPSHVGLVGHHKQGVPPGHGSVLHVLSITFPFRWLVPWLLLWAVSSAQVQGASSRIVIGAKKGPTIAVLPFDDQTRPDTVKKDGSDEVEEVKSYRLSEGVRAIIAATFRAAGRKVWLPPRSEQPRKQQQLIYPRADVLPLPDGTYDLAGVSVYLNQPDHSSKASVPIRHCDYEVSGSLSQMGDSFRIDATLKKRRRDAVVGTAGETAQSEAALIGAAQEVGARLVRLMAGKGVKERIVEAVSGYRTRQTTYEVAVASLTELAAQDPFVANMHLLSLANEHREPASAIVEIGQGCIKAFNPRSRDHVRLMMALGIDPFLATIDALIAQRKHAEAARLASDALRASPIHRAALQQRLAARQ